MATPLCEWCGAEEKLDVFGFSNIAPALKACVNCINDARRGPFKQSHGVSATLAGVRKIAHWRRGKVRYRGGYILPERWDVNSGEIFRSAGKDSPRRTVSAKGSRPAARRRPGGQQ